VLIFVDLYFCPSTGCTVELAGTSGGSMYADGIGTNARFAFPTSIIIDHSDTMMYVVDQFALMIRSITMDTNEVAVFCGAAYSGSADGDCTDARFSVIQALQLTSDSTVMYVACKT
jgi:hypothetical protein